MAGEDSLDVDLVYFFLHYFGNPGTQGLDHQLRTSYPSRPDTPILQGLTLRIPASKTVGLVGGSGSGKSTIVSLIQRFYDPAEGEILLDGYNINNLNLKWLRSQMGLVNQEPIATSIKENILFGKEGTSFNDVVAAAKDANAHDFIVKFPGGYDTNVEAVATKDELQHVAQLCKSEVDSMGRITAGVLHVLKLEGSVGQSAMNQLSNLGKISFLI
ncbi:multidrug resistance protein [Artemisia annua]|uniref:Multidrug resistance protein n=1 Tax=Artemisia annua TaxID=35608 RepID=A0A2U1NL35_ARTAN|nr:multidrug resistance protein [Artemisia annua]